MQSELKEYWQPIVDELLKSGLSRRKFALEKKLPPSKVNYWAHKLRTKSRNITFKNENSTPKFLPVQVSPIDRIQKHLPDPKWLACFIKEITRSC